MSEILLVSDDIVVLARRFKVVLAVPDFPVSAADRAFFDEAAFEVFLYDAAQPEALLQRAESVRIIVVQGYVLSKFPGLRDLDRPLVADIYDPFVLENLFIHQRKIPNLRGREAVHLHDLSVFNELLRRGDHFLVASDRQKDLVTGCLLALGRIGPEALDAGASLDHLLSVVPFGAEVLSSPDRRDDPSPPNDFQTQFPQIRDDDILVLWGGVLSSWYDPETLLRAIKTAREADPRLKLLFLSTGHPNPLVPSMDAVPEAKRLSAELGLPPEAVIFNDGWIEYKRRGSVFRRADIGVSIHKTHFETRYAFRTRMLDYLKYGLPIVGTEGDVFAELVAVERLGRVVRSGDVEDLARALVALAGDAEERAAIRGRMAVVCERFLWERTVAPLAAWCERTLAGDFRLLRRPARDEIARVCAGPSDPAFRDRLKAWAGPLGRRLPSKIRARLRRFWKA
jgi:glycosyltransferase involved in cell wall biosynthesis